MLYISIQVKNFTCTLCSHRPIVVGPKVVQCAFIDPLRLGPIGMDYTVGQAKARFKPQCRCCSDASWKTSIMPQGISSPSTIWRLALVPIFKFLFPKWGPPLLRIIQAGPTCTRIVRKQSLLTHQRKAINRGKIRGKGIRLWVMAKE